MAAKDVKDLLDMAVNRTGIEEVAVRHKPRLLSDNGPCYLSGELKDYLRRRDIEHTRGAPYHPMTQGKIERYHRSMKNVVKLNNYYSPGDLIAEIDSFVEYYNNKRYHESLNNVTPADVYFGRDKDIEKNRKQIKWRTLRQRKKHNLLIT